MNYRQFYDLNINTLKLPVSHLAIEGKSLDKKTTDVLIEHNIKNVDDLINAFDKNSFNHLATRIKYKLRLALLYLSFDYRDEK